jgi:hypothetical protein
MAIPYMDRSNEGQGVWFGTKNAVRITGFAFAFSSVFITTCILWDDGAHVRVYEQSSVTFGIREENDEWQWPGKTNPFEEGHKLGSLNWAEGTLYPIWKFIFLENRPAVDESWAWSLPVPYQPGSGTDGRLDWPQDFSRVPIPLNGTWILDFGEPQWMPGWMQRVYWYDRHLDIPEILAIYVMPVTAILVGIALMFAMLYKMGLLKTVRDAMIALFTGFMLTYLALTLIGAAFRGQGQELVPPTHVPNLEEYPNILRDVDSSPEFVLIDVSSGTQV